MKLDGKSDTGETLANHGIAVGIAIGIGIGSGIGVAMGNIAMGIGLGVAAGAVLGSGFSRLGKMNFKKTKEEQNS